MFFPCINSRQVPREVLKTEAGNEEDSVIKNLRQLYEAQIVAGNRKQAGFKKLQKSQNRFIIIINVQPLTLKLPIITIVACFSICLWF